MTGSPTIAGTNPESLFISSASVQGLAGDLCLANAWQFSGSVTWPVANKAFFVPIQLESACLAKMMACRVVTTGGNIDVGIYSEKGVKLVSMGSTAVGAAGKQTFDIADTWIGPGTVFLAMACSLATPAITCLTSAALVLLQTSGIQEMASAFPLPANATFANPVALFCPEIMAVFGAVV